MVTDIILSSLINLFALVAAKAGMNADKSRKAVSSYLTRHFGIRNQEEYLALYDELCDLYQMSPELDKDNIVRNIVNNLGGKIRSLDEPLLLLRLMEFSYLQPATFSSEDGIFKSVAQCFKISDEAYSNLLCFATGNGEAKMVRKHAFEGIDGSIRTLFLNKYNIMLFIYDGNTQVMLSDVPVLPHAFQQWQQSDILKSHHSKPVYYSNLIAAYGESQQKVSVTYTGQKVNFRFPGSDNGMHDLTFTLRSGELLAIMGGSGTGKTTLLSLLNGSLLPSSGSLRLNGHDIHEPEAKALIGYVPQDDLLVEELTVYQNLLFTAKLCFAGMTEQELDARVMQVLRELDLEAAKDLKVGSAISKYISGGQRKRLNIALELIREPAVLFLDEPTSGLSSSDTERVILLLKEQTFKGKLIVVNIHQPSSDVYKLFDRLWLLDKGGFPVFDGNPIEAVTYFKTAANYADASTSTCPTCGNVNPEVVLNIIDAKKLDQNGHRTTQRKVTPKEWHQRYLESVEERQKNASDQQVNNEMPASDQRKPSAIKQFVIQLQRNIATKITNRQYILLTLFEAPLLALICGYLTRYAPLEGYSLLQNKNFVSFMFMAVIVAIFLGMSGSAEEIIKDRALLKREKFLQLSHGSYISSKIFLMALVSALQTLLFTVVGQCLMGFFDLTLTWWMILFVASLVANLTGLLLSQCLSSVVSIYITIPLLLIPQILLCGLVVDFSDLNSRSTTGNVPVIGNMIPSRWAFEAMAVTTYTNNEYESLFFKYDQMKFASQYYRYAYLYELDSQLETWNDINKKGQTPDPGYMLTLKTEIPQIPEITGMSEYNGDWKYESLKQYIRQADSIFMKEGNKATLQADYNLNRLYETIGKEEVKALRNANYNLQLETLLQNSNQKQMQQVVDGHIVPLVAPVFLRPRSTNGGAPFYSAVKRVGSYDIQTLWFNMVVLIIMALVTAILLYTDCPGRYIRKNQGF